MSFLGVKPYDVLLLCGVMWAFLVCAHILLWDRLRKGGQIDKINLDKLFQMDEGSNYYFRYRITSSPIPEEYQPEDLE